MRLRPFDNGYVLMVIVAVAWSGNPIVGRGVHALVPPVGLAFWRFVVAFPIFVALAWPHLRRDVVVAARHWPTMVVLSILSVSTYSTFVYIGLDHTTAINMVLINTVRPAIIVLMSLLFFRVPVSGLQTLGLALGMLGTGVLLFHGDIQAVTKLELNVGDLWILAATVSWATYTVFLHRRPPDMHPASFLAVTTAVGVTALLPFYLWEARFVEAVPLTPVTAWSVAYLAVFCSAIAYLAYNRMVDLLGANRAGLISYLIPAFGVALAIPILGETLHPFHAVGITMLLLGTYLGSRSRISPGRPQVPNRNGHAPQTEDRFP